MPTSPLPDTRHTARGVIEALAPLSRRAGSPGEQQAAQWLAERFAQAGCEAAVEEESYLDGYAEVIGQLAGAGALAGAVTLAVPRMRALAATVAAAAAGLIGEDIAGGPRLFRRATGRRQVTWNVVARCADRTAPRTLVVLAHHDAAPTGAIFDDRAQGWVAEKLPGIIERIDTSLPLWWPVVGSPALIAVGALTGRPGLVRSGLAGSLVAALALADVARSPVSPGANDNLTGVASLVALAERLRERPLEGLSVLLVSCGAEEVLQGGIHGFARRHLASLDRERTWVLNLDTVGSPRLIMLEGEGPLVMEDYPDRRFRDVVARAAERGRVPLRRGMRSRLSTDAVVPARAGFPTATLGSVDRAKRLSHYHKLSDVPAHVDLDSVAGAVAIAEEVARELAANPWL